MKAICIQQPVIAGDKHPLATVWAEKIDALIQVGNTAGVVVVGATTMTVDWAEYQRLFGLLHDQASVGNNERA